jgi:hypothetical protein
MFRSENLRRLLVLKVAYCPVGEAASALAEDEVMPHLVCGKFYNCAMPPAQAKLLSPRGAIRVFD